VAGTPNCWLNVSGSEELLIEAAVGVVQLREVGVLGRLIRTVEHDAYRDLL